MNVAALDEWCAHAFPSRVCTEQRPFKRDEDGSFIVEVKTNGALAGAVDTRDVGGECGMDDDSRQQNIECQRDLRYVDSAYGGGEERLVESLGAVAINKRRKTGP